MTPGARAGAAIELLDQIVAAAAGGGAAADTLIQRYFKTRRYAGSKDRRAVRELVYRAVRRAGERPESGRAALVGLADEDEAVARLFDGGQHAPAAIDPDEPRAAAGIAPAWLLEKLAHLDPSERPALLDRAPLDLRVNRLKASREAVQALFADAEQIPHTAMGLRLPEGGLAESGEAFTLGLVEVQDAGSQRVALACGAAPGMTVVDLCAGGGGKTLALAADMTGEGALIACDADRARLSRLMPRAERAGVDMVETRLLDPGRELARLEDLRGGADLVVVDAPCSGTGTWRRNPEARWRLTPERLRRLTELQAQLLDVAAALVKPGGALVHIVCSLLPEEGPAQVDRFLAHHRGWRVEDVPDLGRACGAGRQLSPASDRTDGFFFAKLRAPC